MVRFKNRLQAGNELAAKLLSYRDNDVIIYALPRGGIEVARQIAQELNAPLELIISRKVPHPENPEFAVCSLTETGPLICQESFNKSEPWLEEAEVKQRAEAKRRREEYIGNRERISAKNKTAIIVDDGIATGLTILAAIEYIKKDHPKQIVVAVPVSPRDKADSLREKVDDFIALEIPYLYLGAVAAYYKDFPQVSDNEVKMMLNSKS